MTFRSCAELVRYYLNQILSDGEEHSLKEIKNYVMEKGNELGYSGASLEEPAVLSAIRMAAYDTGGAIINTFLVWGR